ncbi:putative aquaporin PIP2-6 [Cladobotryum mycophilum]|uniref:Aquaporin PIP2-6 n=1 Tax=Cladobotryum mycophilum TaxID=491253 RepID=A0ABR0T483_9HYPO
MGSNMGVIDKMESGTVRATTRNSSMVFSERAAAASIDMRGASFDGSFVPLTRPRIHPTTPWYRNRDYFLGQWLEPSIWRSAVVEAVATAAMVYISGQIAGTLQSYETNQLGGYIGISNIFLLSVMIYATAPATGGHMNPVITFSAILTGLCPVARGVLYLCGQTLGASLAAGVLRGVWGHARSMQYHGGGCFWDASQASSGQVFLNEVFATFCLLYLSYGVGLDPRQALLLDRALGHC